MFRLFQKKQKGSVTLFAPVSGHTVPLSQIEDDTFRDEILGKCWGIAPNEGALYAPCDGTVQMIADTGHAIGLNCRGADLLLHQGIDTVLLGGGHFSTHVRLGARVKQGDLLLTFDRSALLAAGVDTTLILVLTNPEQFSVLTQLRTGPVQNGDPLLLLEG